MARTPAWQRREGKNPSGGLNATGRASLRATGYNIKPPVTAEHPVPPNETPSTPAATLAAFERSPAVSDSTSSTFRLLAQAPLATASGSAPVARVLE